MPDITSAQKKVKPSVREDFTFFIGYRYLFFGEAISSIDLMRPTKEMLLITSNSAAQLKPKLPKVNTLSMITLPIPSILFSPPVCGGERPAPPFSWIIPQREYYVKENAAECVFCRTAVGKMKCPAYS